MSLSRREFLRQGTALAVGAAVAPVGGAGGAGEPLPTRVLGRTGRPVSVIGFGLAPLGSDNTTPEEATRIVTAALDLGVTYLDVAPVYGSDQQKHGNAERKLKEVLRRRRAEVFLVTKVNAQRPTRDGVLQQLEESLKRMDVNSVDAVHVHNLGDFDMEKVFTQEGALGGLLEARRRGLLRHIGASGHMRPARFVRAIETGEIDLCMNALNFADRHTYDFEGLVLPAARKQNTGIVAMKVLGGAVKWQYDGKTPATLAEYHERAIRYSLGLPGVACAVIGFASEAEVRKAVEVAKAYRPLSDDERQALLAEGQKLAATRGEYYGPVTG